jgi:hypothetical protein
MLQTIQQQFECMNVVVNEILDRMDRQGAVIAIGNIKMKDTIFPMEKQSKGILGIGEDFYSKR